MIDLARLLVRLEYAIYLSQGLLQFNILWIYALRVRFSLVNLIAKRCDVSFEINDCQSIELRLELVLFLLDLFDVVWLLFVYKHGG